MINTILALIVMSMLLAAFLGAAAFNGITQICRDASSKLATMSAWQDQEDSLR